MPFSNKQSDIFYNDQTKEMFVCTVSAITAARCETGDTIYGALPIIYKIDKDTNYRQTIYPDNLDTFHTDENSDIFKLTPPCPVEDLNFDSITKPLINYNKDTSRYSVTFLGRFASDVDGLVINNYIFEDVDSKFYLLKAESLLPQNSLSAVNGRFTFDSGYLNSDLYLGGNTIRNQNASWFNPADGEEVERSPNYMVSPTHVESTSAIGFNLIQDNTNTALDALTGDKNFPLMFSGGYITVNPKYAAYDPQHTIRIDFRARSFNVPAPTAYASTQTVGNSASRWVQQYSPAGAGEGFCVYLFEQPQKDRYVVPNGVASTLGYSPADFNVVETAGSAQTTVGLFERNNWNPFKETYGCIGDGQEANSFIGVGFDIAGNFGSTSEDKPGWFNVNTTTPSPCSVSIRGNRFTNNQILTSVDLSAVPGSTAIPLHTSAADAVFVDYRVDLTNKGNRLTVSHKLTSSETYNTILDLRLNKIQGSYYSTTGNAGNVGGSNMYDPWSGFQVQDDEYPLLNIGLSFTTSTKVSQFELHSFEVKGVRVHNPWDEKIEPETQEQKTRIDYINKSSKNLRERLTYSELDDNVDIEMVVPAKSNIASELYEQTNTTEITLCDINEPEFIEEEVEVKYTGIRPEDIDTVVQAVERGDLIPEIGGGSIPRATGDLVVPSEPLATLLPSFQKQMTDTGEVRFTLGGNKGWSAVCFLKGDRAPILGNPVNQLLTNSANAWNGHLFDPLIYNGREYCVYMRVRNLGLTTDTKIYYTEDYDELNELFIDAIEKDFEANGAEKYTKVWELMPMVETPATPWEGKMSDWEGADGRPDWNWVKVGSKEDAVEKYQDGGDVCMVIEDQKGFLNLTGHRLGQDKNGYTGLVEIDFALLDIINTPDDIAASAEKALVITLDEAKRMSRLYGIKWEQLTAYEDGYTYYLLPNTMGQVPNPTTAQTELREKFPDFYASQVGTGGNWFATKGSFDLKDLQG